MEFCLPFQDVLVRNGSKRRNRRPNPHGSLPDPDLNPFILGRRGKAGEKTSHCTRVLSFGLRLFGSRHRTAECPNLYLNLPS